MVTLQNAVDVYLRINRSPHTTRSYGITLHRLTEFLAPECDLVSITASDVLLFLDHIRPGLKPSSEATHTVILKTFFKWCMEMNFVELSPAYRIKVRLPKPQASISRAMPKKVLNDMYSRVQGKQRLFAVRDYALLCFLDDTACRRGAVAELEIDQIDFDQNIAYSLEKGGDKKPLEFSSRAAAALKAWLKVRPRCKHNYVFTHLLKGRGYGPLQPGTISSIVYRLSEQVGERGYGPHSLRRLVAQEMYENGESELTIRDKLNHKNFKTTEQHYLYRSRQTVRKATDRREARRQAASYPKSGKIIELDFSDEQSASL